MSGYVNIGRTDDPAYRYKMPRVVGKVEGRGNGIKTVIVNIIDLGLALHRAPDEVCKFMGCELGAQTIWIPEQERAIVNGAHKDNDLQELVHLYVDKFVLCPTCKYPETSYKFKLKKDEIYHKCKACGAADPLIDEGHRLCKFILNKEKLKAKGDLKNSKKAKKERKKNGESKNDSPADSPMDKKDKEAKKAEKKAKKEAKKEKKRAKKEKKKAKKEKKKKKGKDSRSSGSDDNSSGSAGGKAKGSSSEEEEVWASEGAAPIVHDTTVETASPAEAMQKSAADLAAFIAEGKDTRLVIEKLGALQLSYKLGADDRCGILFTAAFGTCTAAADFLKTFQRFKTIFRQLITGNESELVACFDRHFTNPEYTSQLAVVPLLLQLFHNEDLLSASLAKQWHASSEPTLDRYSMVDAEALAAVKAKADGFIDSVDDDSDSSSSSDSD
eukprot:INCI3434.1.p1 GENE.INCI3434.1~~INCI3434.1.p1  ORF type:complete len:442 (+),score=125.83 INCI3434.1:295-1620(+)